MKNSGLIAISLFLFLVGSAFVYSECEGYMPLQAGTELTYEDYNAKDKLQGSQKTKVKDIQPTDQGYLATIASQIYDDKGKMTHEGEFTFTCENGTIHLDMKSMIPSETLESMKDMEMEISQSNLITPHSLEPGTSLPDANINIKVSSNGFQVMEMKVDIVDRMVEKAESITTPAGTFETVKLTYTTKTKMGFVNTEIKGIDWVAKNIGVVRSESFNKKGELESYRILTSVTK